jgi:serine/threonine protein kinase
MSNNDLKVGTILNNLWKIDGLLGEGACGKIYTVSHSNGNVSEYPMVVKVIPTDKGMTKKSGKEQMTLCNTLYHEYQICVGHFASFPLRPRTPVKFFGDDKDLGVRYFVMEKMNGDLRDFAKSSPNSSSIASIGLQLLDGFSWIHQKGLLFIDTKPDNFMLKEGKLYFIDFGLVELPSKSRVFGRVVGTPEFFSKDVHNGEIHMWKDELESMCLVLLSLANDGSLPWGLVTESMEEFKRQALIADINELSTKWDLSEIAEIIIYIRSISRIDPADPAHRTKHRQDVYNMCRNILIRMRDRKVSKSTTKGIKSPRKSSQKSNQNDEKKSCESSEENNIIKNSYSKKSILNEENINVNVESLKNLKTPSLRKTRTVVNNKRIPIENGGGVSSTILNRFKIARTDTVVIDGDDTDSSSDNVVIPELRQSRRISKSPVKTKTTPKTLSFQVISGSDKGKSFQSFSCDDNTSIMKEIGRDSDYQIEDEYVSDRSYIYKLYMINYELILKS